MKKLFSTILVALVATVASYAQTIAVVSSSGVTTMYQTLDAALAGADDGSVIYLPGGGFQVSDDTQITKKVTIMGVSHRADTDNAEGATTIAGNLWFNQGSDGSAVMGVYVSGTIHIGNDGVVNNVLVRYCNVDHIDIHNSNCSGTIINQNYIRGTIWCGDTNAQVTNNILHSVRSLNGGTVDHNVIYYPRSYSQNGGSSNYNVSWVKNSMITNNMCINGLNLWDTANSVISTNMGTDQGDNPIEVSDWKNELGENFDKGINILSNFHLVATSAGKGAATDGTDVGPYGGDGGDGLDDVSLAPIPRIVSKEIPEQTDASGKLNIKITVKAK